MKIVISDETKEKFDCFKKWENWYCFAWITSIFYCVGYVMFNTPLIFQWKYNFDITNIFTQLFILFGLILISPFVGYRLSNCVDWWCRHYKNGVLTL